MLFFASPLHDIGKVGIRDNILLKPANLEYNCHEIVKIHSEIGYDKLKYSKNSYLQFGEIIAKYYHEKYGGSGYFLLSKRMRYAFMSA